MTIFITFFLLSQPLGLKSVIRLSRAVVHVDGEFAIEVIAHGHPDIPAVHVEGCAA